MKIKRFEFNMFPENCYVLWDETLEAVVIDPGCFYEEEKQALKNFIISNGLQVKHLLNTHLHLDHIFGNPFMLKEFGLKAEANQADEFWIDEAPKQSRMFGSSCRNRPYRWALTCTTETSSPSAIRSWKPSTCGTLAGQPGVLLRGQSTGNVLRRCTVPGQHRPCRPCRRQLRRTDRTYMQPPVHTAQRNGCLSGARSPHNHRHRKGGEPVLQVSLPPFSG